MRLFTTSLYYGSRTQKSHFSADRRNRRVRGGYLCSRYVGRSADELSLWKYWRRPFLIGTQIPFGTFVVLMKKAYY